MKFYKKLITNYPIRWGKESMCLGHIGYAEHCSVNARVPTKVAKTLTE